MCNKKSASCEQGVCICQPIPKKFDPTKPVQTRDGRKARIVSTDRKCPMPIMAFITCFDGKESYQAYFPNGRVRDVGRSLDHPSDLVNIPEKRWINLYRNGACFAYMTKADADVSASENCIGCIEIDWPE